MLQNESCIPCREGAMPLTALEVKDLINHIPGWFAEENNSCLVRSFKFPDFFSAFSFVADVARLAEEQDHHPDITFGWGYCTFLLRTHAINGLHRNDFVLAAKINQLANALV